MERKKESYGKQKENNFSHWNKEVLSLVKMKALQDKATPVKEGREEKEGGKEGRKGGDGKWDNVMSFTRTGTKQSWKVAHDQDEEPQHLQQGSG